MDKKPFFFAYNRPSLDWYETIHVQIAPDDYTYFRLERRFGPSWWLIGMVYEDDDEGPAWIETQLGELVGPYLYSFIEWAKTTRGSKIIEVKAISGEFNIIDEIIKAEQARGYLVTLPCKLTDTIHIIEGEYKGKKRISEKVTPARIDHFTLGDLGIPVIDACTEDNVWYIGLGPGDYFLTVEDAQAAIDKEAHNEHE